MAGVIVVDASVLIAHFDAQHALHERAVENLLEAAEQPLACSPLTLAEVLVGPARHSRLEVAREALARLGVREVAFAIDAPARLASLRAETNLNLPDCCVLLAAEDAPAARILTFDERLAKAARLRRGLGVRDQALCRTEPATSSPDPLTDRRHGPRAG
jgi:predicted nucleic acid-binding protein